MASAGASFFGVSSPLFRREPPQLLRKPIAPRIHRIAPRFAVSVDRVPATIVTEEKRTTTEAKREEERNTDTVSTEKRWGEKEEKERRSGWKEYLEQAKELIAAADGGPPRWFSPLECGSRLDNSPLMLFLPG